MIIFPLGGVAESSEGMMLRRIMKKLIISTLLMLLPLAISCDRESPTMVDRPPVISKYFPLNHTLQVLLGDTIFFTVDAFDPDNRELGYQFLIDDSIVSTDSHWAYAVSDTGTALVACSIIDGSQTERIVWRLNRLIPINLSPVIINYEPDNLNPSFVVGSEVDFSMTATDPEGRAVSYEYLIGNKLVSNERRFTYQAAEIGVVQVFGRAFDGERYSRLMSWNLNITDLPDSILPAPVVIVTFKTGAEVGQVELAWIAVGDDGMEGMPAQYQVRTSSAPITSEWSWDRASDRPGEPPPAAPGDTMRAVIGGLIPANYVYVAVRAIDEFGNLSPLVNSPGTKVKGIEISGIVRDALTRLPIANVSVNFASQRVFTGADGAFAFSELPQYSGSLVLRDEDVTTEYGEYYNVDRFYQARNRDVVELWMIPNLGLEPDGSQEWYGTFLSFFKELTDTYNNPFGNYIKWYALPINVYIPEGVYNDIDFEAEVASALDDWETLSGLDLFKPVAAPPDTGIIVVYEEIGYDREKHEVTEWTADWYPVKSTVHLIKKYTPITIGQNRRVIRHEFGHALGIKHSNNTAHLMVGGIWPQVPLPTTLELQVLKIFNTLPRGEYMECHEFD